MFVIYIVVITKFLIFSLVARVVILLCFKVIFGKFADMVLICLWKPFY